MSRYVGVVVIARGAREVMAPLTRPDDDRAWHQCFTPVEVGMSDAWTVEFVRHNWDGLLPHLEALAWPRPETVQVPIGGEDDDCFGLWMMYGGRLVEVPLPHTLRHQDGYDFTGWLTRTDGSPAEG
ncbi:MULTISPECIES: hypothetical protein [Streptomyces]|uniref:hypothetical protein n=1 Tax=Streptomyces TaxID=1883 RepID=UPI002E17F143|nr:MULTISPECIES: hypothetical protein [unclassified Streptomyces]